MAENTPSMSPPTSISPDPIKVKDTWFWVRDSKGNGSVTLTFALIAFIVTTLAYILSIVEKIGPVAFRSFDIGACGSYFGTVMMLYFGRRWTEAKYTEAPK